MTYIAFLGEVVVCVKLISLSLPLSFLLTHSIPSSVAGLFYVSLFCHLTPRRLVFLPGDGSDERCVFPLFFLTQTLSLVSVRYMSGNFISLTQHYRHTCLDLPVLHVYRS